MHALLYSVPQPCSRPPPTHTTTGDSWTLTGKSGSVSCGVTAFSWVLVHTSFCLCPPRVGFLVLCKFWQLYGGVNDDFLQGGLLPYPGLLHPEPLPLWKATADPYLHRRRSNTVLSQSLWGLWVLVCTRFVWALWMFLMGMGFDSKCIFAPPICINLTIPNLGGSDLPCDLSSWMELRRVDLLNFQFVQLFVVRIAWWCWTRN